MESRRRRPFGVHAVIVLLVLNALAVGLDAGRRFTMLARYADLPVLRLPGVDDEALNAVVRWVAAAAFVVVASGLWRLRRWAWVATMLLVGASLALGLVWYGHGEPRYLTMVLNVLMVFYLNQRDVQGAFERRRTTRSEPAPTVTA